MIQDPRGIDRFSVTANNVDIPTSTCQVICKFRYAFPADRRIGINVISKNQHAQRLSTHVRAAARRARTGLLTKFESSAPRAITLPTHSHLRSLGIDTNSHET